MKHLPWVLALGLIGLMALEGMRTPARADKAFFDEFVAKYVKPESTDPKEQAFKASVEKVRCNVCHVGRAKKDRNVYGQALDKLLDRQTDKDNKPKIRAALDTVAKQHSKPDDDKSPTFGELIDQGKLPAGAE